MGKPGLCKFYLFKLLSFSFPFFFSLRRIGIFFSFQKLGGNEEHMGIWESFSECSSVDSSDARFRFRNWNRFRNHSNFDWNRNRNRNQTFGQILESESESEKFRKPGIGIGIRKLRLGIGIGIRNLGTKHIPIWNVSKRYCLLSQTWNKLQNESH